MAPESDDAFSMNGGQVAVSQVFSLFLLKQLVHSSPDAIGEVFILRDGCDADSAVGSNAILQLLGEKAVVLQTRSEIDGSFKTIQTSGEPVGLRIHFGGVPDRIPGEAGSTGSGLSPGALPSRVSGRG